MTILGSAYVEIRAIDTHLKRDIEAAAKKIKDITVTVKADVDLAPVRSSIAALRAEVNKNPLKFTSELNDDGVVDGILKAHQLAEDNSLKLNTEVDDFGVRFGLLAAQELYKDNPLKLETHPDTTLLETELERIHREYGTMVSNILPNAVTGVAERQLNRTARTRIAPIVATPIINDPQIKKAVIGFRNALMGMIPPEAIKTALTGLFGNLEGLAVKASLVSTAIGSIFDSVVTLGANIFTVSEGIGNAIGILAMAPAALYGGIAMITGTKMAWKGYFDAFDEDVEKAEKAIAKLPPQAQVAARAFRGFWGQIQKSAQSKYWEEMGTALQEHLLGGIDELIEGFDKVSVAGAKMTKGLTRAWFEFQSTGRMSKVFDNIATGMTNAKDALGNFLEGFNTFATVGSEYLPTFGTWVDGLSTKFKNWAEEAERTGKMNRWIEEAVSSLKDMGSILSSSGSILKGFTIISDLSGGKSLNDMANGMRNIADVVNGEPFRSRMVSVFEGARRGMDALGEGVGDLMEVMGRSTTTISAFLDLTGQIGGTLISNFGAMGNGTGLGHGLIVFLDAARDAAREIRPAFEDAGEIAGNLLEIFAELLSALAPGLNKAFDTLNEVIKAVEDGIKDVIPIFNEFIQGALNAIAPIVILVAESFGNLLESFAALPTPIRNVMIALGLLAAIMPKVMAGLTNLFIGSGDANKRLTPLQQGVANLRTGFNNLRDPASKVRGHLRNVGESFQMTGYAAGYAAREIGGGMRTSLGNVGTALGNLTRPLRDFGTEVRRGMVDSFRDAARMWQDTNRGIVDSDNQRWSSLNTMMHQGKIEQIRGADDIAREVPSRWRQMGDSIRSSYSGLRDNIAGVSRAIGDSVRGAGSSFRQFGADMSRTFSGINWAGIRGSFSDLGRAIGDTTGAIGRTAGSGMRMALGGLMDVLGGPWGIALAAVATGVMIVGQKMAEEKSRIDAYADSLDVVSGKVTDATKRLVANDLFDGPTNWFDDAWRHVTTGGAKVEDTLDKLGVSHSKFNDIIADSRSRSSYISGLQDISVALSNGKKVTDEMLSSVGLTREAFESVKPDSFMRLADVAKDVGEEVAKSEEKFRTIAKATGTTTAAAAELSANWDILAKVSSTAGDRFNALKRNLELVTAAQNDQTKHRKTSIDAEKAYYETLDNVSESMSTFVERNKVAVGTLYDVKTGFDVTSSAGRELHTAVTAQADGILQLGTAAMDKALKAGKDLGEAQKIAMDTMQPAIETLKQSLRDWGMEEGQINSIIESLGLIPEDIAVALNVEGGDAARREIFLTQLAADSYANKNYEGVLAALPDDAKAAIMEVLGLAGDFDDHSFEAILKAMDESGPGKEAFLANILSIVGPDVDYVAELEAMDLTKPAVDTAVNGLNTVIHPEWKANITASNGTLTGINDSKVSLKGLIDQQNIAGITAEDRTEIGRKTSEAALKKTTVGTKYEASVKAKNDTGPALADVSRNIRNITGPTHTARLSAQKDSGAFAAVDRDLDLVARARTATITVVSVNGGSANPNHVVRPGQVGAMANGGIITNMSNMFAGKIPPVKAFASGGFENHVAQISRGQTPFRIWSEPETGGEAYLPLAKSKRPRSEKILEEVARIFGFSLVKKMSFANGGFFSGFDMGRKSSGISVDYSAPVRTQQVNQSSASAPNVTMNVYPSAGLNEEQIGQSAMNHMFWKFSTM